MPATIVQDSNFLINSQEYSHFCQFDLIDVEVADVIPEAGP